MSNIIKYYAYLIVFLTILPIFKINTSVMWVINFFIIYISLKIKKINCKYITNTDVSIFKIYFFWLILCCIRGCIIADNYWEWKQLISVSFYLIAPIFIFSFSNPYILKNTLNKWAVYILPFFTIIGFFLINSLQYQFTLAPIYLLACFIPFFKNKWKLIIGAFLILLLVANLGARSQTLKAAISIIICLCMYYSKYIPVRLIKYFHLSLYIVPVILLVLGITGKFNIFEDLSSNEGKFVSTHSINGETKEEDLSADTRTFIYMEIIESAVRHNYVIWGRTPARGNDSAAFGAYNAKVLKTGKYERFNNELCHPNVFTWLGIIGMILYSFFYIRASYLAIYRSNNIYIKVLGLYIAFHWAYGWVENPIDFNILNITLWMTIAMGMSNAIREMSNIEFKAWASKLVK